VPRSRGESDRPPSRDGARAARATDAAAVAELWWRTRLASVPAIPEPVHDESDVRGWVEEVLIPAGGTWVVERGGEVVAMMTVEGSDIDQLYVAPDHQHRGLGTMLVELARELSPAELTLWTFQSNTRACRFYEGLGFVVVGMTDGDNEEGAPDLRYRWRA
jgi:ribosomal protein S18 acetylase RimI-like enzyme